MSNWIKCTDRLPDANKTVIVCCKGEWETPTIGHTGVVDDKLQWCCVVGVQDFDDITHWQPLPEPPSE